MTAPLRVSPFDRRRDRLRRWREEDASALRSESDQAVARSRVFHEGLEGFEAAARAAREGRSVETPFRRERPNGDHPITLAPAPREGMRPSRRRPEGPPEPDPYSTESRLAQVLAQVRYQSPLTPLFRLGRTEAELFHTLVQRPLAAAFGGPFRGAEDLLESRIEADRARENVVRSRYMSPVERGLQDLAAFAVEFETGTRALGPAGRLLRAPAPVVRAGAGAGRLARAGAAARNIASRAAVDAAAFGSYETGKAVATGEDLETAAAHGGEGLLAGAIFGGGLGAAREAAPAVGRIVRPFVEGVAAIPGAVGGAVRRTAQDALVAEGMLREGAGRLRRFFARRGERPTPLEADAPAVREMLERPAGTEPVPRSEISGEPLSPEALAERQRIEAERREVMAQPDPGARTPPPNEIVRFPTEQIVADPERFQFKTSLGAEGVSGELKAVRRWNPQLAGVVSVWRDPADGVVYVVNGHHRLELAQRLGVRETNVQFLDAPSAEAARAEGAFINIAEQRGSPIDVAKFLRDFQADPAELEARGVSVRGDLARQGMGLRDLAADVFDQVATGKVPQGWGVAIGEELRAHPELQREAVAIARGSGKRLSEQEVRELARQVRAAEAENVQQSTLFGEETERRGLYVPRAQLVAALRKRLTTDRRLFGYVSREGRAGDLARAGSTHIDVEAARGLADASAQVEELFTRLYTRSGPIADVLTAGARRIARGEKPGAVASELYPSVSSAVADEIARAGGGAGPHLPERGEPAGAGAPSATGAPEGPEGRLPESVDPTQDVLFLDPTQRDFFGRAPAEPRQGELLGERAGTPASRPLRETEAAARAEVEVLRERLRLETDPDRRGALARQIAQHERLLNRGRAITAGELATRLAGETAPLEIRHPEAPGAAPSGLSAAGEPRPAEAGARAPGARPVRSGRAVAFDTSRFEIGGPDVTQAELPDLFHVERWEAGKAPAPAALRREVRWGGQVNRLLRRVETAIQGATEEASRLEAAGDAAGAREARAIATELANRKAVVEQQADHAIARAQALREAARGPRVRGRATEMGMEVREPTTPRTPLEPGYEQPLAASKIDESLPDAARPSAVGTGTAPASPSQIVRRLEELLGIPIRVGKMGPYGKQTLAIYNTRTEVVRTKVANRIERISHEVGHHMHTLLFGKTPSGTISSRPLRPWVKELKPLAKGISDQSSKEGLAEFFRRYLTNVEAAREKAPTFYAYVEKRLSEEFPELHAMFTDARAAYRTYLEATPEARVAAGISTQPQRHWSLADRLRRFATNVVDDLYDVEAAQREIISSALGLDAPPWWRPLARAKWMAEVNRQTRWEENAADLARLVRGSAGTAEHFVRRGALDYATLEVNGPSLEAVLRPVSEQFDDFLTYAVSRRANELHRRSVESGFRPEDTRAVVQKFGAREHFTKAFEGLQDFQRRLLEYLRDAGVLSPETYARIVSRNEEYLPFYRVLDDELARRRGAGTTFGQLFAPVKRIKGSGRDVINPFESIIRNTYLYTRLAARQRVATALARLSERDGAGVWIERVHDPKRPVQIRLTEAIEQLQRQFGLEVQGPKGEPVPEAMAEEMLMFLRPGDYFGKDNMISVLEGGRRAWYEVDPDLYRALMGLSHEQAGALTRFLTFPAKTLRLGATLSLEFIGRNPIRDQLAAFVQSEYGFKPGMDWGRGLWHMLRRDDLFWKWKAAGGERTALLELDRDSLGRTVRDVLGRPPGAREVLRDVVKSPIELLRLLSAAAEDATRIGEFARGVEREGVTRAGYERAAAASREVSVDFARHGAKTEAIRLMTAFWNARLQGYHRLYRAMRDHPVRTTARAGVAITLPSALLFYANKDEPDYWAKPQWERDLFWHVKLGETWYKIPKPFELGLIFGTIPERMLEWAHSQDPRGIEQALVTLANDAAALLPLPTTAVPLIENFGNWSLFRRQPLVSRALQDVQPEFQFTAGTSEIARGLGRMLGIAPTKIDNVLFGWTGGLGRLAVDLADVGAQGVGVLPKEPRPSRTAADIPGVRGFISRPAGRGSEDVERFYAEYQRARAAKNTRDLLDREDRFDELERFETDERNLALLDRYEDLDRYAQDLGRLRREIGEISRDESLTPDERRREVEALGREMQQLAAEAIERRTPASAGARR